MKKIAGVLACIFLMFAVLEAAAQKPAKNAAKSLQKGSVVSGSKMTGDLKRWMLFNDGFIGGSWTKIGASEYVSVDLGYSSSITTIAAAGGLRGVFGIDFEFPIYVAAKGQTNILSTHNKFAEVLGWGAFVPASVGIDINGFYLRGLVGYGYNEIEEGFDLSNSTAKIKARYHGLIYGASVGYRIKNIINIGAKALFGEMKNDVRSTNSAELEKIKEPKDGRYNMMRIGGYISIIF